MKRYGNPKETILGVSASSRRVHAVLVHDAPDGPVILRHFVRDRAKTDPFSMPDATPENVATDDVSIQIGDHPASDDSLFLTSEFGSMGGDPGEDFSGSTSAEYVAPNKVAEPFAHELMEILKQCEDAGYENPRIAFALASEHLGTLSFEAGAVAGQRDADEEGRKSRKKGSSKEDLVKQVKALTKDSITDSKIALIPMRHRSSGDATHLAVYAQPNEPVSPTVRTVRDRRRQAPNVGLIDTEVSLFFGLARAIGLRAVSRGQDGVDAGTSMSSTKGAPTTLVVRAGVEDTLVMFIQGDELIHFENLRSITAFDPSETVCSRVLLLQDEFGVGDADQILLFSADREDALLESFREFFDESEVSSIRTILPTSLENLKKPVGREGVLASAAALRLVNDELYKAVFLDVDFLDRKLRGPRIRLPFSWSAAAMALILFCTTLFFVYRYFAQEEEIQYQRYALQHYPDDIETTTAVLQSRIDSVRQQTEGLVSALDVLDSLLVGSDKWSRLLESMTNHTQDIRGIWVETIYERNSNLHIEGTATDRNQVVALASYTGANIETLKFSEIREWPVFSFTMKLPLQEELPEAARYLRERALIEAEEEQGRSAAGASHSAVTSEPMENSAG